MTKKQREREAETRIKCAYAYNKAIAQSYTTDCRTAQGVKAYKPTKKEVK